MSRLTIAWRVPPLVKTPFLITSLISASLALLILTLYFRLPPKVPLFYSYARPEQYLADKEWMFLFPALSFAITIGHTILVRIIWKLDTFLLQLFAWVTVVIQVLLAVAAVRIVMII